MPNPLYLAALFLSGFGPPQTPPAVEVERLADAAYRLTVTVAGTQDPSVAQGVLDPTAADLCGDQPARYGRYRFTATGLAPGQTGEANDSVTLVQDLACGEAPPDTPAPAAAIDLAQADIDALTPVILGLSSQYFKAVEQGRHTDAFALTTPEMTGESLDDRIAGALQQSEAVGSIVSRRVARLSWYPNPPNSPRPGLYVAVDYDAAWSLQDECGYLIWFRPDPGTPFRLTRQEQIFLPRDLDAGTRAALRAQRCVIP